MFYMLVGFASIVGALAPWLLASYFYEVRPNYELDCSFIEWLQAEQPVLLCCLMATVACSLPLIFH